MPHAREEISTIAGDVNDRLSSIDVARVPMAGGLYPFIYSYGLQWEQLFVRNGQEFFAATDVI